MNSDGVTHKSQVGVLIGIQLAVLMAALDQTILNTAIPRMSVILQAVERSIWIVTSYLLFSTVATPVAGKLSDIFGTKKVLIAATVLFTIASALCGSAGLVNGIAGLDAMNQLIAFRALQGIAGGAMLGACFVSMGDLFTVRERGKHQGFLAAAFILAAIVGPALGGLLADVYSWRMIFYINIPLGIISSACLAIYFPQSTRPKAQSVIDFAGIIALVLCIFPLILGVSGNTASGQAGAFSKELLLLSVVMFVVFLLREGSAKEPLIPLSLFRNWLFSISLATVFVSGIGLFGSTLILAFMLQKILGISPSVSGMLLTPLMLIVAGASIIGGSLIGKTGRYKLQTILALAGMGVGSMLMSSLESTAPIWIVLSYASIAGIGLGLLLPIHSVVVQNLVPPQVMGVATSMTQFFRSLGGTIGTGVMGALMFQLSRQSTLEHAVSQMFFIYGCAAFAVLTLNIFLTEAVLKKDASAWVQAAPGCSEC